MITPILIYLSWARGISHHICDNLIRESLISSPNDCLISWNSEEYIPTMFPLGVSKEYVEKGMQGLHLESDLDLRKIYFLRRSSPSTPLGWMLSLPVLFIFDKTGRLIRIEFELF